MYTSHGVTWIQSHISLVSKIPIKMHSYGTVCTSLYCYDKEILKAWSIVNVRWQIWENKNMTWISSYIESQCLNDKNNGAEHDQVPIKTSWIDFWRRTSLLISLGMAIPWTGKIYSPVQKSLVMDVRAAFTGRQLLCVRAFIHHLLSPFIPHTLEEQRLLRILLTDDTCQ